MIFNNDVLFSICEKTKCEPCVQGVQINIICVQVVAILRIDSYLLKRKYSFLKFGYDIITVNIHFDTL